MKRIILAITLVLGSFGYAFYQKGAAATGALDTGTDNTLSLSDTGVTSPASAASLATEATGSTQSANVKTQTSTTVSKGQYRDGTYTGNAAYEPYGVVQVAIVVSGGKITDVKLLQVPRGERETNQISSYALPILVKETIAAQSANIDAVSGASLTSPAYVESLQSATASARA